MTVCDIKSEMDHCLKNLSYPVNQNWTNEAAMAAAAAVAAAASAKSSSLNDSKSTSDAAQIQAAANKDKFERAFKRLAKSILTIESPSFHKNHHCDQEAQQKPLENTLIKLLVQPLEKRFKFHFCTSRKTNNLDKVCFYLCSLQDCAARINHLNLISTTTKA